MLKPLRNKILVRMDESLPNAVGIFIAPITSAWREAQDQISNRGTVVRAGEGLRHHKTSTLLPMGVKVGDIVRFSELQYPTIKRDGVTYALISDFDVVGVES